MKRLFTFLLVVLTIGNTAINAQDAENNCVDYIPEISLDTRFGYSHDFTVGEGRFGGNGLLLNIDGKISPNFSYSLNHCLATYEGGDALGFGNTNWLTLTYENDYFYITAGKEDIKVGSFEYDTYDLDAYYDMNSTFYNEFDCWQWGISGAWYPAEDQEILLQIANSPYSYGDPGMFSFATGWRGAWDWYESYWTANLWMAGTDGLVKGVNLGNRFYLGNFTIDLDLLGRFNEAYGGYNMILAPSYNFGEWGRLFAKAGADSIDDGWNIFFGGGFEYFPLKENKDIRLHAVYTFNEYTVGQMFNLGLTWKMNLTKGIKRLMK